MIGIVGPIGSGKDTAALYISEKLHIPHLQISQPLKDIAREKNLLPTRDTLIQIGIELTAKHGGDFLAKYLLDKIEEKAVISGMRIPDQITFLQQETDTFLLLAIDAEPSVRFERVMKRGKLGEAMSLDEFIKKEEDENTFPNPQRVFENMKRAQYHIVNNTNKVQDLYWKIDKILENEKYG